MPSNGRGQSRSSPCVYSVLKVQRGVCARLQCSLRDARKVTDKVSFLVVKHGKLEQAEKAISRLQSSSSKAAIPTPQETVALLQKTDEIEQEISGNASYIECFKGINLRRTEIATATWTIQQMCGPVLQTFATYLFIQAGLDSNAAFDMTLGLYAIAFVGTVLSWPMINRFGRRTIFLGGLLGIFVCLMIVGFLGIASSSNKSASWAAGAFLLIFTFIYDSTVGPLTCE
jgi:MFS transporter, SP family, general alpha glucoside:H+ symporter